MAIDTEINNTSTIQPTSIETSVVTGSVPVVDSTKDLQVEVNRKEYSIVGDELYIPKRYEEAPQWLRDIIDTVVDVGLANKLADLNTLEDVFDGLIAELDIAKNTYTQSIISSNDIDTRINTAITTLNSTLASSDASILNIANTKVTPEEALTIATNVLSASINGGDIAAAVNSLQTALATEEAARATDYTNLEAAIAGGLEDEATARATAVQYLDTYVGITEGTPNGTGLLADVEILQKQNDGVIETYTNTYDVMLNPQDPNTAELVTTAEPYATWIATDAANGNADTRLAHIGDIYVKYQTTANGAKEYIASYKFVKTTVDSTSPYATDTEGFTWALIVDQAAQAAFEQALNAYDLADNKRRVFTATPYGPYDIGDLWTRDINGSNQIWRATLGRVIGFLESEWTVVSTDDTTVIALKTGLEDGSQIVKLTSAYIGNDLLVDYVSTQIDDQIGVYSGTTAPVSGQPSGVKVDDIYLWFTTETSTVGTVDVTKTYKYSGTAWSEITTNTNITALADLADGKRTIYSNQSHDIPTGEVNDIWIPTTGTNDTTYVPKEVYQHNGTGWVLATKYTEDLSDFIDEVNDTIVPALENQIDGKIEYWFNASTDDPKDWWAVAERANRDGDVWYQIDTKASYYYTSNTNSWNAITDKDAIQALADAAEAKSVADSKITSYYIDKFTNVQALSNGWTAQQKLDNVGDLATVWNDITLDYNGTWRWNGTTWVNTRDKKLIALATDVTNLSTELNNGTTTWANADSTLSNTLTTKIENDDAIVEGKFEYGSNVTINGITQSAGFGLVNELSSVSGAPAVGESEFWINADKFRFTNTGNTGINTPFTIDATGTQPEITFNGKVTFGSGQTGTIDEAIASTVNTIAVGDKNINITDNLIPTTSLVADTNNSGYQFVGTPVKSNAAGLESFAEAQIALGAGDEVYSPYVSEHAIPYYYRYGITGVTDVSSLGIYLAKAAYDINTGDFISAVEIAGNPQLTLTQENSVTLDSNTWYVVDGIMNPSTGSSTSFNGSIRIGSGTKIDGIQDISLPSVDLTATATERYELWIILGWLGPCTISRMKLAKITADTMTGNVASVDYVDNSIDSIDVSWDSLSNKDAFALTLGYESYAAMETAAANGQTIIDGGSIRTDLIDADNIIAGGLKADVVLGNTIAGNVITGSKIYGAQIEGAIIKASYIDLSSTATLTNWQQYTPTDYPSEYDVNFAKNNDGTLLVDSQGYVRLMGNTKILTKNYYYSLGYNGSTNPAINRTDAYAVNLYGWNNYTVSSINRMITDSNRLLLSSPSGNWSSVSADYTFNGMAYNNTNTIIHTQILGSTAGTVGTAYIKFNLLGDIYECYTYKYTASSSYSMNWYLKKNSVTLDSGTNLTYTIHTDSKCGLGYGIFVGDWGVYGGGFPMIKIKFSSIDFILSGLLYNEPIFDLIESTAVGNSYVYRIDIPNIEVV